jgi:F-type H+-transporting ATPase subunit epsilon
MSQLFTLKIVSPSKLVFDAHANMVEIPGREGDFGVLKDHAPMVSLLRPGVITVHLARTGKRRYFIIGGYAEISETGTTILSDHVQELEYINPTEAKEALTVAQQDHDATDNIQDRMKARRRLEAAQALVTALHAA